MDTSDMNGMQAVIDAARQGVGATKLETVGTIAHYLVATANNATLQKIDLEAGLAAPLRKRGTVRVFDAVSFNAILSANDECDTTIYIDRDVDNPAIVAVLNGNGESGPGWGDFRVEIVFRLTPQWRKWKHIDGKMLPQVTFAEFIEENIGDIVSPPGADMLEIAQDLSARRSVDFKSNVRLADGRLQFQNVENMEAQVGPGQIGIPPSITLGLAPVQGLPPFKVEARFRYRIENGKLTLGVKLQRLEDIMAAVVNDMVTGTVGVEGRPAVVGIDAPQGTVMVEGIAPVPLPGQTA
jgi:uncharacterized protein YfdQ (DUF2303 family)